MLVIKPCWTYSQKIWSQKNYYDTNLCISFVCINMCEILIFSPHIPSNLFIFILQKCGAFDNNINRDLYKTKFAQNFNTFYACCKNCIKKKKERNKSAFNSSVSNSIRVRSSNKRKILFFKFHNWKKNHLIYNKIFIFPIY